MHSQYFFHRLSERVQLSNCFFQNLIHKCNTFLTELFHIKIALNREYGMEYSKCAQRQKRKSIRNYMRNCEKSKKILHASVIDCLCLLSKAFSGRFCCV